MNLLSLAVPSQVGKLPFHVPVVTIPPFVFSQTLVVCPTRANPVLQEYLATEPRLYLFSLLAVAIDIVPFCGAGDSEQNISVCVK